MMKHLIFLSLILWACDYTTSKKVTEATLDAGSTDTITIGDIYHSLSMLIYFRHGVGTNSMCIENGKCTIFFTDMCSYEFDCVLDGNKINLIWGIHADCIVANNLASIVETEDYPTVGEAIGYFTVSSNSSLRFQPYHPDRLYKLNDAFVECDTLFPSVWQDRHGVPF